MDSENRWIVGTIVIIWLVVLITSFRSPELVFGSEPVVIKIAAIANWFWGLMATLLVLRATVFRRPEEAGWRQTDSWPWIAAIVSAIWFMTMLVTFIVPAISLGDSIEVPFAAIVAPPIAVGLSHTIAEFLITGFAARRADARTT